MLGRLAPRAHRLWVVVETLLHGLEHVFVLPSAIRRWGPVVQRALMGQFEHAVVQ